MWKVLAVVVGRAAAHGLGIDWGTEFHKTSTLVPGQHFRAVENDLSKRKTHNLVAFCGEERFFDAQAIAKLPRSTCQSFYFTARLLHEKSVASARKTIAADERHITPVQVIEDDFGWGFKLQSPAFLAGLNFTRTPIADGTSDYLRQEELIAMIMEKNLANAATTVKSRFSAGVLSLWSGAVPIRVRRIIRSAFALAGLRLDGVVQENVAAAIYDSLGRESEAPPQHVYLINIGSSGARLSVVTYASAREVWADNTTHWVPSVTPQVHVWSKGFSGHGLDACLADAVLAATGKTATAEKTRQLYQEVKRVKEILSANREMQLVVEDFFGQSSLSLRVTREMLDSGCGEVFAELRKALKDLRTQAEKAGLRPERAELLGGITRVPRVQEIIKETLRVTLSSRINGDEGMALGATLISANSTAGVRVQKIINNDRPDYGVVLEVQRPGETAPSKTASLFEAAASRYGMRKLVTIDRPEEGIELTLREKPGDYMVRFAVWGVDAASAHYAERNVTEQKMSLSFELDGVGIPHLRRAELVVKEMRTDPPGTNRTDNATSVPRLVINREALRTNKTAQMPLTLEDSPSLFAESELLLRLVGEREAQKRLLVERRNKLESAAYTMREVGEEGSLFLTQDEQSVFAAHAVALVDYLESGEATQATSEALAGRLADANVVFATLNRRKTEHAEREKLPSRLQEYFSGAKTAIAALNTTHPWVEQERVSELLTRLTEEEAKLRAELKTQDEAPLNLDPVLTVEKVTERLKKLDGMYRRLRATPRPKTPAEDKKLPNIDELMKSLNLTREQIDELMKMKNANETSDEVKPEVPIEENGEELPTVEDTKVPSSEL